MVLTASQFDAPHIMSLSQVNNASAYAVGLRLTTLQIYQYKYWTVAETQKKGRSAPRPCVDLIIILFKFIKLSMHIKCIYLSIVQYLDNVDCLSSRRGSWPPAPTPKPGMPGPATKTEIQILKIYLNKYKSCPQERRSGFNNVIFLRKF